VEEYGTSGRRKGTIEILCNVGGLPIGFLPSPQGLVNSSSLFFKKSHNCLTGCFGGDNGVHFATIIFC